MNYTILDSIFEPVAVVTKQGELVYYNHYFSSFFKASPRVLKKIKAVGQLFCGYDLSSLILATSTKGQGQVSKEETIELEDQTQYHVVFKTIIQDEHILICVNDISIEKNLYTKYRYQIDELKSVHNQIIQADKLSTVGEITASISHEISNPLTIASGTLELLNALIESDDIQSQLPTINTCIEDITEAFTRIDSIVKGMKSFLHKSDNEEEKEYYSIEEIINSSLSFLGPAINKHEIEIDFDQTTNSIIQANKLRLEQVFVNLIKNAIDSLVQARTDSPKVSISIKNDGFSYCVNVKDNGPGIAKGDMSKIFESFYSTKELGEGTGLGLSISSKIIEAYQGNLEVVDSKVGADFLITLPKMEVTSFSTTALAMGEDLDKEQLSILFVDNEPRILNLFTNLMSELDQRLICASSVDEALKILENYNVDLIISDYFMPNKNGDQLVKELRELGNITPIFLMSGSVDSEKINDTLSKYKVNGFLNKPFKNADIQKIIRDIQGAKE